MELLNKVNDFLWGSFIAYLLLGVGAFYTIRLGVPQLRHFGHAVKCMKKNLRGKDGDISGFSTLCVMIGGQVGTGSLVGVASALGCWRTRGNFLDVGDCIIRHGHYVC